MLGTGDVDYMDPNISYYSIGYLAHRLWSRQLYTYPGDEANNTKAVPDLATGPAEVSADGLAVTLSVTNQGNTDPGPPTRSSPDHEPARNRLMRTR